MRTWLFLLLLIAPAWAVRLDIRANPADAVIVIDREIRGTGSVTLDLPPGPHLIRVSAGENWVPYTKELNLTADQQLSIRLEPGATRLTERALALLQQGQYLEAAKLLEKAARQPRQVTPWFFLGVAYYKADDLERALVAFRQYAHFHTDYPELFLFLGDIHERSGRLAEAYTAYKSALLLTNKEALNSLPKPTDAAIKALGEPKDVRGRLRLAQLNMLKGNLAVANFWAKMAIQQTWPAWKDRNWAEADPPGDTAPPDPTLPKEGPQR